MKQFPSSPSNANDLLSHLTATDPSVRLAQQQRLVNQRLGLDVAEAVGVDVRGIVSPDDLTSGVEQDGLGMTAGQGKVWYLSDKFLSI